MILLVLAALVARVDASPAEDARAEAIRYANILTGADPDADPAIASGDDDEDEDEDEYEYDDEAAPYEPIEADDEAGAPYEAIEAGNELGTASGAGDAGDAGDELGAASGALDAGKELGASYRAVEAGDERGAVSDDDDREPGIRASFVAEEDRSASLENADLDPAGAALAGHATGELAILDAGATDLGAVTDDVSFAAASAGAAETYESWMRHQRPSRWGRLDVGVEWRRRWSEPMSGLSHRYDEVWLVATWRR